MSNLGEKYRQTRILIADDDGVSRFFCTQALALPGVRTLVAENGRSAIRTATLHVPDIVVMDACLQDMSGVDAIALIRQQWPHSRAAPCFVGMTADDSASAALAMQTAGCERILTKPFSSQALVACMREACGVGFPAFGPAPGERKPPQKLRVKFNHSLAGQLAELDAAVSLLNWATVQRMVHRLSGAAAMAGHREVAQTGQALLRCLPPAGSTGMVAELYIAFLQRMAEIRPE